MTGHTTVPTASPIHGRSAERRIVAALADRLGTGSAVLVLTGEPGLGRTTLLDETARSHRAGPVLYVRCDAADAVPYGGVHALATAAGRPPTGALDSRTAPQALLDAFRVAAGSRPLLVCLDDVHMWDAPSRTALARAARRLSTAGRIGLLVTAAGPGPADRDLAGLPALPLHPLPPPAAAALLDEVTGGAVDPVLRDDLLEEAEGNPALLLAMIRRLTPAQLSGGQHTPRPLADARILTGVTDEWPLAPTPAADDLLLLTAAAMRGAERPEADAALVRAAWQRLSAGADGLRGDAGRVGEAAPVGEAGRCSAWGADCSRADVSLVPERSEARAALVRAAWERFPAGGAGRAGGVSGADGAGAGGADSAGDAAGAGGAPGGAEVGVSVLHRGREPLPTGCGHPAAADPPLPDAVPASLPDALPGPLPDTLVLTEGRLRFTGPLSRRAVYARAAPDRRRVAHRALAQVLRADGQEPSASLHAAWAVPAPAPAHAARLAAVAATTSSHRLSATAFARAAELTPHGPARRERYTAAAEQALLAGRPRRALRLLAEAGGGPAPDAVRGRAELVRGIAELRDGPVADARASLLSAAALLTADAPAQAGAAALAAADAAWAAGDITACREALAGSEGSEGSEGGEGGEGGEGSKGAGPARTPYGSDYRLGLGALLDARIDRAGAPLRRVVERARTAEEPEELLRSAAAALVLGDMAAAVRAGARALAAARTRGSAALVPQALEYLAYAELRAGHHALARTHAEEGLRAARRTGQRNTAAHHHAVLALAASIEGETAVLDEHVSAALATARAHGLAQPATLAQWAAARADLGRGRPLEAADRLGPLVCPGPRRGHFAVWMLAVPCFVEAAVLAGRPEAARTVVSDFAAWAGFGADPQAPAQLLRCHALLAPPEHAGELYDRALALHEQAGGDFERARTELLYGKWLRRRRRPREARDRLGAALVGFDRCGALVWAEQTRAELRANGAATNGPAPGGSGPGGGALARLTPQQWRIARHVAQGATNREVARSLSVSTRTVDYHLRNVFAALGVRSRLELARLVDGAEKTRAQL
ncbi:LuxR C-terminal-related transcriptional regulator [Streptomyces sp. enrichment culture]|uniref:LuxR C-terminal-related transcriptional regulator n=1 Tax=Streptomyces sp. enrichment culture TaxID=1795815 RepID=UPI003F56336F